MQPSQIYTRKQFREKKQLLCQTSVIAWFTAQSATGPDLECEPDCCNNWPLVLGLPQPAIHWKQQIIYLIILLSFYYHVCFHFMIIKLSIILSFFMTTVLICSSYVSMSSVSACPGLLYSLCSWTWNKTWKCSQYHDSAMLITSFSAEPESVCAVLRQSCGSCSHKTFDQTCTRYNILYTKLL